MKKIFIFAAMAISAASFAQKISNDKVPAAVMTSFKTKFPSVTKSNWEMESASEYEADFDMKGKKHSAKFDKSGNWIETETEIKVAALPKAISAAIAKEFVGYKVEEAEKAETAANGTVYEVKVEKGKEFYDVQVSSSGKILKKEMEKEEKDND